MIELEFQQRPVDISPDLRLYRRLAMLAISMSECCRVGTASLRQLQFLNSLYFDEKFFELYKEFRARRSSLKILAPSADPYLNRCIHYAIGAKIVSQKNVQTGFKLILTYEGQEFVKKLRASDLAQDIFIKSAEIGKISDSEIDLALMLEK